MGFQRARSTHLRGSGVHHRTIFARDLFARKRLLPRAAKRVARLVVVELAAIKEAPIAPIVHRADHW